MNKNNIIKRFININILNILYNLYIYIKIYLNLSNLYNNNI